VKPITKQRTTQQRTTQQHNMTDYKTLYEQQLQENKKLKQDHIKSIMNTNRIAKELYREVKYSLGYGEFDEPNRKELYEEIKNLKEQVNYWKNFALVYWSGNQLGNLALAESCDSDVWNEALEECNKCNSEDDYDREALTKKCLSQ
jgi:hypothetical protein